MNISDFQTQCRVLRHYPISERGVINLQSQGDSDTFVSGSSDLLLQQNPCPNYAGRGVVLTDADMNPEAYYQESGSLQNITLNGLVDVAQLQGKLPEETHWAINPNTSEFLIFERA